VCTVTAWSMLGWAEGRASGWAECAHTVHVLHAASTREMNDDDDEAVVARAEASITTLPATLVLSAPPGSSSGSRGTDAVAAGESGGGYTFDPARVDVHKGRQGRAAAAPNMARGASRKRRWTGGE
jgi:hypothetical protein